MDIHMPIMDGFQAMKILKQREMSNDIGLRNTKVYALSAITQDQFECSDKDKLFNGFGKILHYNFLVEKPVKFEIIKQIINQT